MNKLVEFTTTSGDVTIPKTRHQISTESAAEVLELARLLRTTTSIDPYAIRGISLRIEELGSIILGALEEEAETETELSYRLRGERKETAM